MLEWIADNKTWLFSGLGVAIPLAIVGWLFSRPSSRSAQKQRGGDGSVNIQAGEDANVGGIGKASGDEK